MLVAEATGIAGALSTALGSTATDALSAISAVLPVALPVMGGIIVISVGLKVFKKVTGR